MASRCRPHNIYEVVVNEKNFFLAENIEKIAPLDVRRKTSQSMYSSNFHVHTNLSYPVVLIVFHVGCVLQGLHIFPDGPSQTLNV